MKPIDVARFLVLPVLLAFALRADAQSADTLLEVKQFLNLVRAYHPVVKQAELVPVKARFDLRAERGNFDPKLRADLTEKRFDSKEYWNALDAHLKIPAWIGEFKAGYERARGDFLNPMNRIPEAGLWYAGYSLPLGAGLLMDERRNTLRQAQQYVIASEAEQLKLVNKFLTEAASDYWQWYFAYKQLEFVEEGYRLAEVRFTAIRELLLNGNMSALDTVEAYTNFLQREIQRRQARLDYRNARLVVSRHLWSNELQPLELDSVVRPAFIEAEQYLPTLATLDTLQQFAKAAHPEIRKLEARLSQLDFERRFRVEMLKPEFTLNYNFLREPGVSGPINQALLMNNYKFGITAGMPLLYRKERGKLQGTRTLIRMTGWERDDTRRVVLTELQMNYNTLLNTFTILQDQYKLVEAYNTMVTGEQQRFTNGESSVFLINTRENTLVSAGVKLAELEMKYAKAIAYFYQSAGLVNWNY
jgi:outer membrane protein TolC